VNCKQGDLAFIISVPLTKPPGLRDSIARVAIGKIVKCISLTEPTIGYGPTWRIEPEFKVPYAGGELTFHGAADQDLRPIRGDEEAEEHEFIRSCQIPRKERACNAS
jgi:hypothetical protein